MAFPVVQTADTKNGVVASNAATWNLTYPTNLQAGDLILAFVATDGGPSVAWPAGWVSGAQVAPSSAATLAYAKKVSDGTETGLFPVSLGASESGGWRVFRITGWEGTLGTSFGNLSSNGAAAASTSNGTSATPDPPAQDPINWATEDTLWIAACGVDTSRTISVYPLVDRNTADVSGGAGGATLGICMASSAVASLNPGTFTISSSDEWASVTIAIRPAAVSGDHPLDAAPGSFAVTGAAATPAAGRLFDAQPGSFAVAGVAASPVVGRAIAALPGDYALAGSPSGLLAARLLSGDSGAFVISGAVADLLFAGGLVNYELNAETGVYTLSGSAVSPVAGRVITAAPGAYALTGSPSGLLVARMITASPGAYALSGFVAGAVAGRVVVASPGSFVVTGSVASAVRAAVIAALPGSYLLTGSLAGALAGRIVSAEAGAYTLTGAVADLVVTGGLQNYVLATLPGEYSVTGLAAVLVVPTLRALHPVPDQVVVIESAFADRVVTNAPTPSAAVTGDGLHPVGDEIVIIQG